MAGLPTIYKRHQGQYTRSLTALGLAVVLAGLCYYVFTLLVSYVHTDKPDLRSVKNLDDSWAFASAWPNEEAPVYRPGDPVTDKAMADLEEANVDRWMFRAARPVPYALYIHYGVPALVFFMGAVGIFNLVNRERFTDFLIATEGEMKKVSWSSKEELIGSTVVVIMTVVILAAIIYVADFVWTYGFVKVGVLPSQ